MHRLRHLSATYAPLTPLCQIALVMLTLGGVLVGAPTLAEEAPSEPLPNVVVTGSRLDSTLIEGAYPVTSIERDVLERSGVATIGELLQQLPFVGGSPISTSVGARGAGGGFSRGTESIELRGLGEQRTLILLNGRRFVSG